MNIMSTPAEHVERMKDEPRPENDADEDYDAEVEAAAVVQSLGAQLWADIMKAKAQEAQDMPVASPSTPAQAVAATSAHPLPPTTSPVAGDRTSNAPTIPPKPKAIISSIQLVLRLAKENPAVLTRLESATVTGVESKSLYQVLNDTVVAGEVDPKLAATLSQLIATLALESKKLIRKRKRKRGSSEGSTQARIKRAGTETASSSSPLSTPSLASTAPLVAPPPNSTVDISNQPNAAPGQVPVMPPSPSGPELTTQIGHATAIIHATLTHSIVQGIPLDANIIASIQAPLHHVFLFAATSNVAGGAQNAPILQEISGLIQALGVLHGVTIAPPSLYTPFAQTHPNAHIPANQVEAVQSHFVDIGTAVYPCLFPGCGKTFSRLFHLRTHEGAHSFGKPFQCPHCSASFTRKHDLKRHEKSHKTTVFKCGGCFRTFTRRDALKRHKMNKKSPPTCASSAFEEATADESELQSSSRRVRASTPTQGVPAEVVEEGELKTDLIIQAQQAVSVLHSLLQAQVMNSVAAQNAMHGMSDGGVQAAPLAEPSVVVSPDSGAQPSLLSGYNLNEEQTSLLERAIASAHEAARAQAELEAQLELGEDWDAGEDEDAGGGTPADGEDEEVT